MALSTQPVKGTRDFYPEDQRLQRYIFSKWREVCERFGYEEYDAPILEPTDLYLNKGNQEIIQEQTYTFTDRGDRSVTLRTEMTPSVSRLVAARRQELAYPLRWYSMPQCWRYERTQRGRGREFYQLNVDLFGVEDLAADVEIIRIADAIMKAFRAKSDSYTIKLSSRQLMDFLLKEILGLDDTQAATIRKLIDHKAKLEEADFAGQLEAVFSPTQREQGASQRLQDFLNVLKLDDLAPEIQNLPAVQRLRQLLEQLTGMGIDNVVFDPSLMRGFEYYTDISFEVFDNDPENNRSMFGGGRYDDLMSLFGVETVPSVGFGMGDITLRQFLENHQLLPKLRNQTDIYIVRVGDVDIEKVAGELRQMGVNVATDIGLRPIDKQIKTADKKGISYVLFVGQKELEDEQYNLKNLGSGQEERHSLQRIVSIVKDYRRS